MNDYVKLFKALSDNNRIRILKMLQLRPLCVCEITEVLALATSTVSKHLSILRDAGFVTDEKEGKWVQYKLNSGASVQIDKLMELISEWFADDYYILTDMLKVKSSDRIAFCSSHESNLISSLNIN